MPDVLDGAEVCRRVQREQGFCIIVHSVEHPIGEILTTCKAALEGPFLPPLCVIGYCGWEEWLSQRARYYKTDPAPAPPTSPHYYHKCVIVTAESAD